VSLNNRANREKDQNHLHVYSASQRNCNPECVHCSTKKKIALLTFLLSLYRCLFLSLSHTHHYTYTHARAHNTHTHTQTHTYSGYKRSLTARAAISYVVHCTDRQRALLRREQGIACAHVYRENLSLAACKCTDTYWYSLSPRVYNLLLIIMNFHFKLKLIFQVNLRFLNVFWDLVLLCASERCSNNFLKNNSSIAYNSKTYDFTVP